MFARRFVSRHFRGRSRGYAGGGAPEDDGGDSTPPAFVSAVVNAAGDQIDVTFDEALDEGFEPDAGDVNLDGTFGVVTSTTVSGAVWSLHLSSPLYITEGDTVLLDYTPGSNPLQDAAGNECAALTNQAVTNNSTR